MTKSIALPPAIDRCPEHERPHYFSANERRVLDLVRRNREFSRADIARATGLTAQSVSRIVEALTENNWIRHGDRRVVGRGQPSTSLHLVPGATQSIGLSLMTDKLAGAVVDLAGEVLLEKSVKLLDTRHATLLDSCKTMVDSLISETGLDAARSCGVGIGVTGFFTGTRNQFNPPEPLSEVALQDFDLALAEALELPVWLDNDGNAAAAGENLAGLGRQYSDFAYIFFSKGLGGSLVANNEVFRGAYGNAGEFAAILPQALQEERPTLELLRRYIEKRGVQLASVGELVDHFDPFWPGIDEWLIAIRPHMQTIVSAISAVFDPQAIVFGGRIPPELAKRIIADTEFFNLPRRNVTRPEPVLKVSSVSGDATSIGAAAMPLKAMFFS